MRLIPPGCRLAPRLGGLILLISASAAPALAQATKAKPPAPTPPDTRPIARYVPGDNLVVYAETDGLEAHAEAWSKTSAYKMLNETSLGVMMEEMGTQIADKGVSAVPGGKISGADLMGLVKMMAQRGFAFGLNVDPKGEKPIKVVVVLRAAAAREHKVATSHLLATLMSRGTKPQTVKKGARQVVEIHPSPTTAGAWWAEGNDIVICFNGAEDAVIETLDGKRPNAVANATRVELARAEAGFRPSGVFFIDPAVCPPVSGVAFVDQIQKLKGTLDKLDYRWGFQDDALMSVTRLKAPRPRKGLLALLDQPKFEKAKLPPLPEGIENFTAMALDPVKTYDALIGSDLGPMKSKVTDPVDELKTKYRVDLRKDVLPFLGPKMAFYTSPASGGTRSPGDTAAPGGAVGGIPGLNMMSALGMAGGQPIPKSTLIAEVKNPVAFGKALDNLMVAVNKMLKDQAADEAEAAAKASGAGAEGADAGAGRPGEGARRSGGPVPAPEFKLMPGKETEKSYVLQFPNNSPKKLPAGVRPTVRLSGKMFAVATSPDAARAALEVKAGEWTVPTDLAATFDQFPREISVLNVSDPRPTSPELLASLPGVLQTTVNTTLALGQSRAAGMPGSMPGGPGGPGGGGPGLAGAPGYPGAGAPPRPPGAPGGTGLDDQQSAGGGAIGGRKRFGPAGGMAGGGALVPGGGAGAPGAGGQPDAGAAGNASAGPSVVQFNISADKLPKADDLRSKMFPSAFVVTSDDNEVKVVTRESFPDALKLVTGAAVGAALGMPAAQAARMKAGAAAGGVSTPPAGATPGATGPGAPVGAPGAGPAPGLPGAPGAGARPGPRGPAGGAAPG